MLFREPTAQPAHIETLDEFFIENHSQLVDPTLSRFDTLWRRRVVSEELPAQEDIDPIELTDLLPHILLANITENGDGWTIEPRLVGQHHLAVQGTMPGRITGDGAESSEAMTLSMLDEMVDARQPHYSMLRISGNGNSPFEAARAVYPLSTDGTVIDRIVSIVVPYYPAESRTLSALVRR